MVFKLLSNIKEIVTIASLVFAIGAGAGWWKEKGKRADVENNLYAKTVQWEDEKGRLVTETTELHYTIDDLENIIEQDSANLSDAEKTIWEAGQTIKDLKAQVKHAVSYASQEIEAVYDSLETMPTIVENKLVKIDPIETDHLKISFKVLDDNTILTNAKYKAKVNVLVDRERDMYTKKGRKRFFGARWISPRWQYHSKSVCDDPNANITSSVQINFNNRK